jgi:hypothetical protein
MIEALEDVDDLIHFLRREFEAADQYHGELATLTTQAFSYYEAQPFGNEIEGRSSIVLPDVQETIDYMQQSVLRAFVSGDRVVEFEATDEADAQAADDATAAINYNFMRTQDGYRTMYDGLFDGLLRKIGVFKTVVENSEKITRETVTTDEQVLAVLADMGVTIEGYEDNGDGTVTATIAETETVRKFTDYAIPLSEFRFSSNARHEDHASYLAHVCEKTRSELVDMGFDAEQVYGLPLHGKAPELDRTESSRLDHYRRPENSKALEIVLLCEEYARADVDGDGIAERVKVFRVEDEILIDAETGQPSIEVVDEHPFAVFCPFPRPHRMVGYSLADKVMHIQYQRSFVGRQLFDGLALSNMPRLVVDTNAADATTYADILAPIPGSPVRVKGGVAAVQPLQTSFDPGKSLAVMEWITGERESLTGITRLNQGLDADAMNKTATGTAMMQAQGQQNEEAIARQFAECIGRLFAKKYRLMKAEGVPIKLKVDGQYREVDPSQWPDDICLVVRVGLGTNSKDKRIQYRMAMAQALTQSLQSGMSGPEHVFRWFDGMARDTGLGQGDDFAYDPDNMPEGQEQKPDPEAEKAQAEMAMQQAKMQAEQELQQAKMAGEQQLAELKLQLQAQQQELAQQLAREKADAEARLAREKAEFEAQLARDKASFEADLAGWKAERDMEARTMSVNRPGGDLDK